MKHRDKLIKIFAEIISNSDLKCSNLNRKLSESNYFEAYLRFIDNSIHYTRFSTIINGHKINGKYLNEKVNKWSKYCIFDKMYHMILNKYKMCKKSKIYHIDGKIITNKYCNEKKSYGRNVKYKSKNSINLQTVTDEFGIPVGFGILKGSDSEISNMIKILNEIDIEDVNKSKKSNKHKKYFTGDAGYDSNANRLFLQNKGYTDLIWFNKRNIKDKSKIKKLLGHKKEKYKKRHIVENYFNWIDCKIPRLVRLYDKKIKNYKNMLMLAIIDLIYGRVCV